MVNSLTPPVPPESPIAGSLCTVCERCGWSAVYFLAAP